MRIVKVLVAACLLSLNLTAAAQSVTPDTQATQKRYSERGQLVYQIVEKWGPYVQEAHGLNMKQWAREMGSVFRAARLDDLQKAANARTYNKMATSLVAVKSGVASPLALGDAAADLVFVPIAPCRILDTRAAGGSLAATTTRGIDVTAVSDYSFQGGVANNCNGVGAAGSFAAAAINFTVVQPVGTLPGHMTVWPTGQAMPNTSALNFNPGEIKGNLGIFMLDQGPSANELNVWSTHATHLVGDVVGYFINPQPTALQCTEVESAAQNFAAGAANNVFAPACPSSYTTVEIQCRPSSFGLRVAGSWSQHCNFINEGSTAATATAVARCCRVPGR